MRNHVPETLKNLPTVTQEVLILGQVFFLSLLSLGIELGRRRERRMKKVGEYAKS